jgi:hypothetical protein
MVTLFQFNTMSGWTDVMWQAVDSTGMGLWPVRNHNMSWIVFFFVFIVVCG